MRWQGRQGSSNIEDRRGFRPGGGLALGGGATLVLVILGLLFGVNPGDIVGGGGGTPYPVDVRGGQGTQTRPIDPAEQPAVDFVSVVLADTEQAWPALLQPLGVRYEEPTLVLFGDAVQSACGMQGSAVGPFYCPLDKKVYLDLSFFRELDRRFGAPGDFAQAYVVAHEVGHHVQNLLGTSSKVHAARQRASEAEGNQLSVRLELQADCYAGVWASQAAKRDLLETGDVEEGLRAAAAIGDDTLQKKARGRVQPESWTHGSSAQRVEWFRRGMQSGDVRSCDTFAG